MTTMTTQTATTPAPNTSKTPKPRKPRETWEPGTEVVTRNRAGGVEARYIVILDRHALADINGRAGGTHTDAGVVQDRMATAQVDVRGNPLKQRWGAILPNRDEWAIVISTGSCWPNQVTALKRSTLTTWTPEVEATCLAATERHKQRLLKQRLADARHVVRVAVCRWVLNQIGVPDYRNGQDALGHVGGDEIVAMALVRGGVVPEPVVPSLRQWKALCAFTAMVSPEEDCGRGLFADDPCEWREDILALDDAERAAEARDTSK